MLALVVPLAISVRPAHADRVVVAGEFDPLPFVNRGYGVQVGIRHPALRGIRVAAASFSLHVPDAITELGGNDGFDLHVEPSLALYVLYYFRPGRDGFAVGGSLRYLRLRYEHEMFPGELARTREFSPEVIVGYQWHPFRGAFYVQPWFALGVTAIRDGEPRVGDREYDAMPVTPFFTVNLGWEIAL